MQLWAGTLASCDQAAEVPSIDFFRSEPSERFVHGSRIFAEGDPGDTIYAVLESEVELRKRDRLLEVVGSGGVFGEPAFIDTKPRSATAISKTDGRLVAIDRQRALEIVQVLGKRLRRTDENV